MTVDEGSRRTPRRDQWWRALRPRRAIGEFIRSSPLHEPSPAEYKLTYVSDSVTSQWQVNALSSSQSSVYRTISVVSGIE